MICEAYVASLPHYTEVNASPEDQMVTVWPTETDDAANELNASSHIDSCKDAVNLYGLRTAQTAIEDARRGHASTNGSGPFLLAWSPSGQKGRPGAPVLVFNFSDVTNSADAKRLFLAWRRDIVENPALWEKGWNLEKVRETIGLWADRYGSDVLKLFGAKE
jgi:hypothetical protein